MLFLRDIQVDIQMRCRGCGHEGVLARPDLERRFGPNYPVLSIAPHYRCSRCNSKDVESGPAPNASAAFTAAPAMPEDFGGALGALQGLLDSVRSQPEARDAAPNPPEPKDDVQNLMGDGLFDTMVEEPEEDEAPPPPQAPSIIETHEEPEADEFDELFAKLVAARSQDGEKGEEEEEEEPPPPAPADSPFDETLAALRALTSETEVADEQEADEPTDEHPLYDETAEALDKALDALDEPSEDLDDIPDEEILSFAIRDPDARATPEPMDELDGEPDEELDEDGPEDEEPLDLAAYRRPPPEHGSLNESLAALRALVEKAAEEPEPEPKKKSRTRATVEDEPAEEPPPPPPVKTAQEKSLEETLAQLRGMLDLDKDPGEEGEPVIKPRRR
ncbi:hypothetical protein [Azospirillum sp.]|uniref:hypothetical protein n=1 Tax=Azospirillum sp. TaxID=34012 RepID=UPI003D716B63